MALKRINDISGSDLTPPYYAVGLTIRRVDSDNPDGTTRGEKVVHEGKRLDTDLEGANLILAAAGFPELTEPKAE